MTESRVSSEQAGAILGLTGQAIRDHIAAGRLHAERVGVRGLYKIQLSDLRALAEKYNYPFDEELANRPGK